MIGLHYFSPPKNAAGGDYPHEGTDAVTLATTLQLARRQGKQRLWLVIKPGFMLTGFWHLILQKRYVV